MKAGRRRRKGKDEGGEEGGGGRRRRRRRRKRRRKGGGRGEEGGRGGDSRAVKVLTLSATVDELSRVHPLCGYKQLFPQLIPIRVPEHHPCKGSTSPGIMDDISYNALRVADSEEEGG